MLILDASVVAKWFFKEKYSEDVLALFEQEHLLYGPTLLKYEISSALHRRVRDKEITIDDFVRYREEWLEMLEHKVIKIIDHSDDVQLGSDLALSLNHKLPDCIYLAMAIRLQAPLVTADSKFANKVNEHYNVLTISQALSQLS